LHERPKSQEQKELMGSSGPECTLLNGFSSERKST
jgi:hypothetical protein